MLTQEQMRIYYNLAKEIRNGEHKSEKIFEAFETYPDEASEIVNFWLMCDEFTQSVVHYLAIEKCRLLYERCYRKEVDKWTLVKRNLKFMLNGLKMSLFGVKECLIGGGYREKNISQ